MLTVITEEGEIISAEMVIYVAEDETPGEFEGGIVPFIRRRENESSGYARVFASLPSSARAYRSMPLTRKNKTEEAKKVLAFIADQVAAGVRTIDLRKMVEPNDRRRVESLQ